MAVELGKFPHEIESLPVDEYDRLITYFTWRKREDEEQQRKARRSR